VDSIAIQAALAEDGILWVRYHLTGKPSNLAIPALEDPARADGLWQTTCFELFMRDEVHANYLEFNFSPSSRWAAYGFAGYRTGMTSLELATEPRIGLDVSENHFAIEVRLQIPAPWAGVPLVAGFSAIIEGADGTKTYWALAHPPGKPDFHHRDCFALALPAPGSV